MRKKERGKKIKQVTILFCLKILDGIYNNSRNILTEIYQEE